MRTLGRTLLIANLMLACFAAGGQAAVIRVDRLTDRIDVAAAPDTCSTDRAAGEPASGTGGCTLRDAIDLANRRPGPDTILIDPEGWPLAADQGAARIPLAGPLPTITDALSISSGSASRNEVIGQPTIVVDGTAVAAGPVMSADVPVTIRGIGLDGFLPAGPMLIVPARSRPPALALSGADDIPLSPPPDEGTRPDPAPDPSAAAPRTPSVVPATPRPSTSTPLQASVLASSAVSRISYAVVVNSSTDGVDQVPGDGRCDTGASLADGTPVCSLRAALMEANAGASTGAIIFDLPADDPAYREDARGGTWVLAPSVPLPAVTAPTTIDGTTQAGTRCAVDGDPPAPSVRVTAPGAAGLTIRAPDSVVRGIGISGEEVGIDVRAGGRLTVTCSRIGAVDPTAPDAGLDAAVRVASRLGAVIGGPAPSAANLLGVGRNGAVQIASAARTTTTVLGNLSVGQGPGSAGTEPGSDAASSSVGIRDATVTPDGVRVRVETDVPAGPYLLEFSTVDDAGTPAAMSRPVAVEPFTSTGSPAVTAFTVAAEPEQPLTVAITAAPAGAALGATMNAESFIVPLATHLVSGHVYEDVNGDGDISDAVGAGGVDVWIFADQGNGAPDAGDPVRASTRTDGAGAWTMQVPDDGTYWVAVDSRDVAPSAGFTAGGTLDDVWAEQTYASAGALSMDGGVSFSAGPGVFVGGARAAQADGFPELSRAEHVMRVDATGGDVAGVDVAFSFQTVANTTDWNDPGAYTSATAWDSMDPAALGVGTDPVGYRRAVFDGRYAYFVPSKRLNQPHGEVLRYDTTGDFNSIASWAAFDPGNAGVGSDPDGYSGAVFDGRFIYFTPDDNGTGSHGEVLRLDTTGSFTSAASWDAFDPGDNGVGTDPDGYSNAAFDGRFVYFAPLHNGTAAHAEVLRYDTTGAFGVPGSWTTFDPSANVGVNARGFGDVLLAGRYLIFAPLGADGVPTSEALRYDTEAPFAAGASWEAMDITSVAAGASGYAALAWDGRYAYFAPFANGAGSSGLVARYDSAGSWTDTASWAVFDLTAVDAQATGFSTATFDGRYLHMFQQQTDAGPGDLAIRYDTRAVFAQASSWTTFSPATAGVGTDPDGATGSVFDGRYVYRSHLFNGSDPSGEILRYDTGRTGQGTLRQFIRNANVIAGTSRSRFAIPTSDAGHQATPEAFTVQPVRALPVITDGVDLDGTTQSQYATHGRPVIRIDGTMLSAGQHGIGHGAAVTSTIRGLDVVGFPAGGVHILDGTVTLTGNWLGVDVDGATAVANGTDGLLVDGGTVTVGGDESSGNVISGNTSMGIRLAGGSDHIVAGNAIGLTADRTANLPNGAAGVLSDATRVTIGGDLSVQGNTISGNAGAGVMVGASNDTSILGNHMTGNGGLGIDLLAVPAPPTPDGVTPNDPGDGDTGGNTLLNAPVLGAIHESGGSATVDVDLDVPVGSYRLEFFANPSGADGSAYGEGETRIATRDVTIAAPGPTTTTVTFAVSAGDVITATLTERPGVPGPTSEFSRAVTVLEGNDPPVNTVPATATVSEDGTLDFLAATPGEVSVADPDVAAGDLEVTLSVDQGTLSLFQTTGLTFSIGSGSGDGTMRFRGTQSAVNAALDGASYTPPAAYSGPATITLLTDDLGNTGAGGAQTDTDTIAVSVVQINDPPVHTVPPTQFIDEDTPLTFSAAGGNAISVSDPDAGASIVEMRLDATAGVLTLSGTAGLVFTVGDGTLDPSIVVRGTLADLNAGLDGLTFAPDVNVSGAAQVSVRTDDLGNTGPDGPKTDDDTVGVTIRAINDAPVNSVPAPITSPEGTPIVFAVANGNAMSISDPDVGGSELRVVLTATSGTLTLGSTTGLSFIAGDGAVDTTMTFTGTLSDVNAALDGTAFVPDPGAVGGASVQLQSDDQGANGVGGALADTDTVAITLTPAPQAPTLQPIPAVTVDEGDTLAFTAVASDADVPAQTLTFSLIGAPAGASIDPVTGAFTWMPKESQGPATYAIIVVVTDSDAPPLSATRVVDVTVDEVNQAPVIDPIADRSSGEGDVVVVTLTAVDPDLPAGALTWSATGLPPGLGMDATTGTISGTVDLGAADGSPYTVTVAVTDPDGARHERTFQWTVIISNSAPVIAPVAAQRVDEQTLLRFTVKATDPNGDTVRYSLEGAPAGMQIGPLTGIVTWTPTESQGPDTYPVTLVATDTAARPLRSERVVNVTVREVNRP
ncbi:MAG: putative Ig domain-containing protein, partial [Thermoleophilia bacterium]|nr:putative Ig domain-containing protein [Thermoleophilia bacterium]